MVINMAPLTDMDTLGKKHQKINSLVQETLKKTTSFEVILDESGNTDLDNLVKIKIASKLKNVQYIIGILKSQDMLYISHAIKHNVWLVTDNEYSNFITPQYLYNELFPCMNSKAICKFLHFILLHLKDESRVEEFYKYYEDSDDICTAIKWLPNCSISFIEKAVEKHFDKIKVSLFKRLCERSFTILEILLKKRDSYKNKHLKAVKFFINTHCREYFKILCSVNEYDVPSFDQKHTKILLRECPEIVDIEFKRFANRLHKKTLAKFLGPDKIKDFLLKHSKNGALRSWFCFENIKHFIIQLHEKERFDFVKAIFIDRLCESDSSDTVLYKKFLPILQAYRSTVHGQLNIYQWYKFTSFPTAFPELKKIIKSEPSPEERLAILKVLISCARNESHNTHKLLQYFIDKHINEPFKFKIQFVNNLLSMTDTHRFKDETWKLLNEIFYNLAVYFESENDVNQYINAIIVYKVLHKQPVPEVIEKKIKNFAFNFVNLKINADEKDLIFVYLYDLIENKLNTETLHEESSLERSVNLMLEMLNLLKQMHKDLKIYPSLLERIKKIIEIKQTKGWRTSVDSLFNVNKSWRKYMFEESLTLGHKVDACLNALKHEPALLTGDSIEMQDLYWNDNNYKLLDRVFAKMRVYWPESFAVDWATSYYTELKQPPPSKAIVRRLCLLLPSSELQLLLNEYTPTTSKIQWSEVDETLLGVQKYLGQNMYKARPAPSPEIVLQYAVGDYLPFTLPSLTSVFWNLNEKESRDVLPKMLTVSTSVALQKHAMRFAFIKLKSDELKQMFSNVWTITKNMTIRAVVFELTYKLLCKEKNVHRVHETWQLLEFFMDNLSPEEDRKIYTLMEKVEEVPIAVRAKFCMKSYKILKSFPPNANCDILIKNIAYSTRLLMDTIDPVFITEIILEHLKNFYVEKQFSDYTNNRNFLEVIPSFLLHCKNVDVQMQRYAQIILPIINYSKDMWNIKHRYEYIAKTYFRNLVHELTNHKIIIEKGYIVPIQMIGKLINDFEKYFSVTEAYYIVTYLRINLHYLEAYEKAEPSIKLIKNEENVDVETNIIDEIWKIIIPNFVRLCLEHLKEDTNKYFPTIHIYFGKILKTYIGRAMPGDRNIVALANGFIVFNDEIPTFLLALKLLPSCVLLDTKPIFSECCKKILAHPSPEVEMHYYRKFGNYDNTE